MTKTQDGTIERDGFLLFWGSVYSNWFPATFTDGRATYNCSEQYMMAAKAEMFGDVARLSLIMGSDDPREQKALGRKVVGYSDKVWQPRARDIVYDGCLMKFRQNPELRENLLDTCHLILVEASPYDRLWGIGLDMHHEHASKPQHWRGHNWLGEVLMRVRSTLALEKALSL